MARNCALLLTLLLALVSSAAAGLNVVQNLVFAALSDWGGQSEAPFTTPGQLSAATALGRVAGSLRPKLVVSAGGNFLDQGLPGARAGLHACMKLPMSGRTRAAVRHAAHGPHSAARGFDTRARR